MSVHTTFRVVTAGSPLYVECESLTVAKAKARYFSTKYRRTFSVQTVSPSCDAVAPVELPSEPEDNSTTYDACPTCGATGTEGCLTKSGKPATRMHKPRVDLFN